MPRNYLPINVLVFAVAIALTHLACARGVDPGVDVVEFESLVRSSAVINADSVPWIHARGIPNPLTASTDRVHRYRSALFRLNEDGFRLLGALRSSPEDWERGIRSGWGRRFPTDLREAFETGSAYARFYGDLVSWFEIENEPDIDFVPENAETYAAFFKAFSLGLRSVPMDELGAQGRALDIQNQPFASKWRAHRGPHRLSASIPTRDEIPGNGIRVVNAPMALPPGPYFEHLLDQDLLSYIDGFNYHYYGYADDFSGVYRQFEKAVTRRSNSEWVNQTSHTAPTAEADQTPLSVGRNIHPKPMLTTRSLPVFLTEYGYGLLSEEAAETDAGRERQRIWYERVLEQIDSLPITGAMAFRLFPMLEHGHNEFGLLIQDKPEADAGKLSPIMRLRNASPHHSPSANVARLRHLSSATPSSTYNLVPSPAWNELQDPPFTGNSSKQPNWTVSTPPPSSVVLDFLPSSTLMQAKTHRGYFVLGKQAGSLPTEATGNLEIYNFSDIPAAGRLWYHDANGWNEIGPIELGAKERRTKQVSFHLSSERGHPIRGAAVFSPSSENEPPANWSSNFWTLPRRHTAEIDLIESERAQSETVLTARLAQPLAHEEPALLRRDDALVTPGIELERTNSRDLAGSAIIRVTVNSLPEPLRPAVIELPLHIRSFPDPNRVLALSYQQQTGFDPTRKLPSMIEFGFRSVHGVHFTVWPRIYADENPSSYWQQVGNFSPMFYSRATGPLKFSDHDLLTFVITLRPQSLPATYEFSLPVLRAP